MATCFNCSKKGTNMYGYVICDTCKSSLRLFTDATIKKYYTEDPKGFVKDIDERIDVLEKDFIKKRIKLLHVKVQLKQLQ